ncbi:hypothetical protein [Moorena producens]|uniref:hypothetical protein n=1 Tax=Moorena producens TaxID=1155739 RepID=UPI003C7393E8
MGSDSRFPIPVPLLGGERGGFRFPIPCSLFPVPCSLFPTSNYNVQINCNFPIKFQKKVF